MRPPVLGDEGHPALHRPARIGEAAHLAVDGDAARIGLLKAEEALDQLLHARAEEARDAQHLARADLEAHVAEMARLRQALDPQHRRAERVAAAGEHLAHVAGDHHRDDLVDRGLAGAHDAHVGAVAHHGHLVAEILDLLHVVRDEDHGDALRPQIAQHRKEAVHLALHERRGRLVQHEHLRLLRQRPGDLHDLLLRGRQVAHQRVARQLEPEMGADQLFGAPLHRAGAQEGAEAQLVVQEHRLGHGGRRHEKPLLMDEMDAQPLDRGGRQALHPGAVDGDTAAVGFQDPGQHLDDRRFAGAVLAHEPVDRAARHAEVGVDQRLHRPEGLGDAGHVDGETAHGRAPEE